MYFPCGVPHTTTTTTVNQNVVTLNIRGFETAYLYEPIYIVFLTMTGKSKVRPTTGHEDPEGE